MTKPQISIIMSVYNGEDYVAESVTSILLQKYKNFEFILFFKRSKIDLKKDLPESFKLVNSINNRTGNIYLLKK